ncbi:MAG: dTMP kinase [Candidatus Lokiarchaeota archaeon]|nr:dTMP kinase [Candidatus Lokiarchaeota archaeon]
MKNGFFIVMEGIDGCGTTTHTELLGNYLKSQNESVHLTLEPSDLGVGKLLRTYLKKKEIPSPTDALLFAADRVEHYFNEILPKLEENNIVISDRYLESSIAYQTAQGQEATNSTDEINENTDISHENLTFNITIDWVETINKFIPFPDLTVVLDIDPKVSLNRKYDKSQNIDKFENIEFLEKVRMIYLKRAKKLNFDIVDANRPKQDVHKDLINIVNARLKLQE